MTTSQDPRRQSDWTRFSADRRHPSPLWQQIYGNLRDRILDGSFAAGVAFPSESQIGEKLQVSRITARRALAELAARGLISREQGRASRVIEYKPETRLVAGVEGMIETSRRMGEATTVALLDHEYVPASAEVATRLQVRQGDEVLWTVRVRSLDGTPFSYAVTWLPKFVARAIHVDALASRPLIDLLEEAGFVPSHAAQTITAVGASPAIASALHVEPGSALLLSERIVHDAQERPIELIEVRYRPDVYRYGVELRRTRNRQGNGWSTRSARSVRPEKKGA